MTDPAATSTKYRLETFGSLALTGPGENTVLGTHGHHRRRLALLAVLAAAGEKGRSRDQLLLIFWPDATQSRARHSLDQLLYTLRSSIGESVFAGANPVRLNSGVVASDVGAFTAALDCGDLERAVKEHRGLFLDGFYLEDAPEFERWVEAERARLSTSYSDALEGLAHRADATHDYSTAAGWWRRLAEFDPISSKHASGFIRALMNAGDHPAALQHAERYEAIVAQELGTSAGPAIASLVAEIRAEGRSESLVPPKSRPPAARVSPTATEISIAATPADASRPKVSHRRRVLPYVIGALVVAVTLLGTALWRRTTAGGDRRSAATESSIVVLPLANVSRDPQDAAFVDGLTEELIAALAKIHNLRVIARTSAFAFKNTDAGLHAIADSLGVANVLVGSVQKVGSQLRVQVRLVDARDGSTRWSETYDRALGDLFAVQSDIAGAVARALDLRLGGSALAHIKRGPTSSIAAHELYLRGNDPAMLRSDSGARKGLEYFRQAIALDSSYAAAYAGLARMQLTVTEGGDTTVSHSQRIALAEQAARKSLALDDSLADAHASLGLVLGRNYDLASAETELKRALTLEPMNARFHEWLAELYEWMDRPTEALAEARRAAELDPLSPTANAEIARALLANDRCDEALAQLTKLRSLRPPLLRAGNIAGQCYARNGKWPEAIGEMQRISITGRPHAQALLGYMLARGGRTDEARRILAALLDRSRRFQGTTFDVGTVYAGLNEKDSALQWLEKATEDRSFFLDDLHLVLDRLEPDPRVDRIRRRLGLQNR